MSDTRAIDSSLINDFVPFTVQDYESLRYTNDRSLKEAFIAGDIAEPDLRYSDVEILSVTERLEFLAEFESVVEAHTSDVLRRAYLPRVAEVRMKYRLLEAAGVGDDARVCHESRALYGAPKPEFYAYAVRSLVPRLERVEAAFGAFDRVRRALSALRAVVPSTELVRAPWEDNPLCKAEPDEGPALSAHEIQEACEAAFRSYGISNWRAVVDAPGERTTFNTDQGLRTVFIPSDEDMKVRKYALTATRVRALLAHEVGTHVVRREHGLASPLALLGYGLAGYLRAEEGIATYREQLLVGTHTYAGMFGYLAVAWALGHDGTPRTFRGLFELLVPYVLVSSLERALLTGEPVHWEELEHRTVRSAWARAVRVYRGTTGLTPGACFTKDIVYLEGNVDIWELLRGDPSAERMFDLGKFDPSNAEHVAILKDLGLA